MNKAPVIDSRLVVYEFRWLSLVGMTCFLVAAALGSAILMAAGLMMWFHFSRIARRFARQLPRAGTTAGRPRAPLPTERRARASNVAARQRT